MAITYITGIPRSGKSYLAVYRLYEKFINEKSKNKDEKFKFAYTNINKFDFSKSDKIKPFDFNEFYLKLNDLYNIYKMTDGKNDDLLIKRADELNIYNVLIVLDEAHNFLNDKEDEILKWWLTYHGHLGHEIWLITQDMSLIATGYKSLAEFFYRAIPLSKRLFTKKFRYKSYASWKMYQKDCISSFNIPIVKDCFNLYHSGSLGNQKSLVHKFIYMFLFFVFLLIIIFYIFVSLFNKNENDEIKTDKFVSSSQLKNSNRKMTNEEVKLMFSNNNNDNNLTDLKFTYIFNCSSDFCFLNDKKNFIPANLIKKIIFKNKPVYDEIFADFNGSYSWYLIFDNDVFNFLNKGVSYEKNQNSDFGDFVLGNSGKR